MASGNSLVTFHPWQAEPVVSNYATQDVRNYHPVLDFDPDTDESIVFSDILPRAYSGGGITVYIHWAASSATSSNVVWMVAFERIGDEQQDIDSDGFATAKSVTAAVPTTLGNVSIDSIAFSNGAEIDSIAVGEKFRIKVTRDADNASDGATGDVELVGIELKET